MLKEKYGGKGRSVALCRANYVVQYTYYVVICSVVLRAKEGGEGLVGDAEKGSEKKEGEEERLDPWRLYAEQTMLYIICCMPCAILRAKDGGE